MCEVSAVSRKTGWYRQQSEYNRRVYERIHADHDDLADWKTTALFYSALHRINYFLAKRTGRAPDSHAARNRRVGRELASVSSTHRNLCLLSKRARCCEGFRVNDDRRRPAVALLDRIEEELPFP